MSFCPQCGARASEAARTCGSCGALVGRADDDDRPAGQTLVLGSAVRAEPSAEALDDDESSFAKTLMGMPVVPEPEAMVTTLVIDDPKASEGDDAESLAATNALPEKAPRAGAEGLGRTRVGGHGLASGERLVARLPPSRGKPSDVAAAPRAPDAVHVARLLPSPIEPPHELGETIAPFGAWRGQDHRKRQPKLDRDRERFAKGAAPRAKRGRARAWIIGAGSVCAAAAIAAIAALAWPSAPSLTGRVRVDAAGHETIDLACVGCPEGASLSLAGARATLSAGAATLPAATSLALGDNLLPVTIEHHAGQTEEAFARVHVAARLRPELAALDADRPAIQVFVEAAPGASVTIDGKPVALTEGRGSHAIDVTESCTGVSNEPTVLRRRISFAITPRGGMPESGVLEVVADVLPLRIDAPGPNAVVDRASFVLAGRTVKGAEVTAAGRPITVRPDGTFAQTMNVSSLGKTRVEVRARLAGKAPRLAFIGVERVDRLETAAEDFLARGPLSYAELASGAAKSGDAIALGGRVAETKLLEQQTIFTMDVAPSFGCKTAGRERCRVRLVQGSKNALNVGDKLRAFGHLASLEPGGLPEVQVDFTLAGLP